MGGDVIDVEIIDNFVKKFYCEGDNVTGQQRVEC